MDLYIKKNQNFSYAPSLSEEPDMDYFFKASDSVVTEDRKHQRRANRTLAAISALIIISFTAGLIVGIKFTGGPNRAIVDPHTKKAVSEIITRAKADEAVSAADTFPASIFPFVIQIANNLNLADSKTSAEVLTKKGHTVIIAKDGLHYKLFVGPFKNKELAENSLQKIQAYGEHSFYRSASIIKRM